MTTPFHEQHFEDLPADALTILHLNADAPCVTKDYAVISTLAVTLREVRSALNNSYSKNILPIMGTVAIIEQLGEAYIRNDMPAYPDPNHSPFKKALYYFNNHGPNDDLTKALYGLRNGIVHNASFYSVGRGAQPSYIFTYDDKSTDAITPSTIPWDGSFNNIQHDFFTTVNPQALLNVVESCISTVKQLNKAGALQIALAGGKNELIFRYLKWKRK